MYKVCFFFDKKNYWPAKHLNKKIFKNDKKYKFYFDTRKSILKKFDIVFLISNTFLMSQNIILNNKLVLVVHESDLPKGRGFNPVQNQILNDKKKIPICLVKASLNKVDSGDIILNNFFYIKKSDLMDDIRKKQAKATTKIIKSFLKNFPNYKSYKQKGKASYFKKLDQNSHKLKIHKTIYENLNILRISNPKFPAYFTLENKKFYLSLKKKNNS
tara:strand:+ start:165 stop:809 length:645 start_codon:yes stop_codon:yes gene_type:complete